MSANPVSPTFSPKTPVPTMEQMRLDRSTRLFGAEGQKLLRESHVLLLGVSATCSELMKNLVLPGVGYFTIVEKREVTEYDLGTNFFLNESDLGSSIAEKVYTQLQELNPLSEGRFLAISPKEFVQSHSNLLQGDATPTRVREHDGKKEDIIFPAVTIIIASDRLNYIDLLGLGSTVEQRGLSMIYAYSNGLVGVLRTFSGPRYITEIMPDIELRVDDLRPLNPWPEYKTFLESMNPFDRSLESNVHVHIPWPFFTYHAVKKWRQDNGLADNAMPTKPAESKAIKVLIKSMQHESKLKTFQENVDEALAENPLKLDFMKARSIPELDHVILDARAKEPKAHDHDFWFLAHGLLKFREETNTMPIAGSIPDFTSTTDIYKQMQHLFRDKAESDAVQIAGYVAAALKAAGRDVTSIPFENIRHFAKHAWELNYLKPLGLQDEFAHKISATHTKNSHTNAFKFYVAHRAGEVFRAKHGIHAGDTDDAAVYAQHTEWLLENAREIYTPHTPEEQASLEQYIKEWARYGGGEPVTTASIVGAVGSQEAIKLIQLKRVPAIHTVIYDGNIGEFTTIDTTHSSFRH